MEKEKERITNRFYAKHSAVLKEACAVAGIAATRRQASKFRNKKGLSYRVFMEHYKLP